jgi:hypothetical protein
MPRDAGTGATSPEGSPIARAFLVWVAFLVASSWVGFALAEAGAFSAELALAAGLAGGAVVAIALLRRPAKALAGGALVGIVAAGLTASLIPPVDTTLLSQDASIHLAGGRGLGRSGGLGMREPALARLPDDVRLGLFEMGAIGVTRVSQSRLPGGVVLPDLTGDTAYPSFAHLLIVWIAIADRVGGAAGVALLGPMFAATAWWAIGLIALLAGSLTSAVATMVLLATFLPEHWFARFLMPEILAQALVWCGVAAARMAAPAVAEGTALSSPPDGSRPRAAALIAGVLCGASLGVAGFARLEQLTIFVPCLLIARAILPGRRAVLPRGALVPFTVAVAHAIAHLAIVPTDYGKRIARVVIEVAGFSWMALGGTPRRVAASLLALAVGSLAITIVA